MPHVFRSRSHTEVASGTFDREARRTHERGAVLLLALILTTTFALMAWSLLASSDFAARARIGGSVQEQAERAAASGVEWAAASALDGSLADGRTALTLADGAEVAVVVATASSPQVIARARCRGAEVALGADLRTLAGAPLPHALAVFGGSSSLQHGVAVTGSTYFAAVLPIDLGSNAPLSVDGDSRLVTTTPVATSLLKQVSGRTHYGERAFDVPVVDTSPIAALTTGAVKVARYTGTTTLSGVTVDGIVFVDLLPSEVLTIRNCTINGTVVVRTLAGGLGLGGLLGGGGLLGTGLLPSIVRLVGATTWNGGTAWTGNLALLAADCTLEAPSSTGTTLNGVVLVRDLANSKLLGVNGQLVLLGAITSTTGTLTITRPAAFVPNTPLGITWPGTKAVRIDWRGRQ